MKWLFSIIMILVFVNIAHAVKISPVLDGGYMVANVSGNETFYKINMTQKSYEYDVKTGLWHEILKILGLEEDKKIIKQEIEICLISTKEKHLVSKTVDTRGRITEKYYDIPLTLPVKAMDTSRSQVQKENMTRVLVKYNVSSGATFKPGDSYVFCTHASPYEYPELKIGQSSITLVGTTSYNATLSNIRQESGYAHLSMTVPTSSMYLYYPFDVDFQDFTTSNYDATTYSDGGYVYVGTSCWGEMSGSECIGTCGSWDVDLTPSGYSNSAILNGCWIDNAYIITPQFANNPLSTYCAWMYYDNGIYFESSPYYRPLIIGSRMEYELQWGNHLIWRTDAIAFKTEYTDNLVWNYSTPLDQWHHYCLTIDTTQNNASMYVDGSFQDSVSCSEKAGGGCSNSGCYNQAFVCDGSYANGDCTGWSGSEPSSQGYYTECINHDTYCDWTGSSCTTTGQCSDIVDKGICQIYADGCVWDDSDCPTTGGCVAITDPTDCGNSYQCAWDDSDCTNEQFLGCGDLTDDGSGMCNGATGCLWIDEYCDGGSGGECGGGGCQDCVVDTDCYSNGCTWHPDDCSQNPGLDCSTWNSNSGDCITYDEVCNWDDEDCHDGYWGGLDCGYMFNNDETGCNNYRDLYGACGTWDAADCYGTLNCEAWGDDYNNCINHLDSVCDWTDNLCTGSWDCSGFDEPTCSNSSTGYDTYCSTYTPSGCFIPSGLYYDTIGGHPRYYEYLSGSVDEVMYFDDKQTPEQIQAIYLKTSTRYQANGSLLFRNLNFSSSSTRLNISIPACQAYLNSSLKFKVNNGSIANITNCVATNYSLENIGNISNANVTFYKLAGNTTTAFYSPLMVGNIILYDYSTGVGTCWTKIGNILHIPAGCVFQAHSLI